MILRTERQRAELLSVGNCDGAGRNLMANSEFRVTCWGLACCELIIILFNCKSVQMLQNSLVPKEKSLVPKETEPECTQHPWSSQPQRIGVGGA